jgi:hypothetical protein
VKVIFNVNVVLDVYDTDGARPCEKPVCKKCASASTSREQKSSRWIELGFFERIEAER